jgi:hypothetical protein
MEKPGQTGTQTIFWGGRARLFSLLDRLGQQTLDLQTSSQESKSPVLINLGEGVVPCVGRLNCRVWKCTVAFLFVSIDDERKQVDEFSCDDTNAGCC